MVGPDGSPETERRDTGGDILGKISRRIVQLHKRLHAG
jgi:hypothetical protein